MQTADPVCWTEKMTETKLNQLQKTRPPVAVAQILKLFSCQWQGLLTIERPKKTSLSSHYVLNLTHTHIYLIFGLLIIQNSQELVEIWSKTFLYTTQTYVLSIFAISQPNHNEIAWCICIHVFMYPCILVFTYLCILIFHVSLHPCIHVSLYPCIHVFMYSCIHISSYADVLTYPCILVVTYPCIHLYMYSCILVSLYSCIHVYYALSVPQHPLSVSSSKTWQKNVTNCDCQNNRTWSIHPVVGKRKAEIGWIMPRRPSLKFCGKRFSGRVHTQRCANWEGVPRYW